LANSPTLRGRDAILKFNQEFVKLPKLTITGEPETIRFSDDGTMAYETGKYSMSFAVLSESPQPAMRSALSAPECS
jgi:hypothetical protein